MTQETLEEPWEAGFQQRAWGTQGDEEGPHKEDPLLRMGSVQGNT